MNKTFSLLLVFCCLAANALQKATFLDIEIQKDRKFELKTLPSSKKFSISHSIDGYAVNCKKDRLLLWGIPSDVSVDAPQMGAITLVDIANRKIIKTMHTGRGVMSVDYLKSQNAALILMGYSSLINVDTGTLKYLDTDEESKLVFETCPDFKGKKFQK